jgi:hypothetical protein
MWATSHCGADGVNLLGLEQQTSFISMDGSLGGGSHVVSTRAWDNQLRAVAALIIDFLTLRGCTQCKGVRHAGCTCLQMVDLSHYGTAMSLLHQDLQKLSHEQIATQYQTAVAAAL